MSRIATPPRCPAKRQRLLAGGNLDAAPRRLARVPRRQAPTVRRKRGRARRRQPPRLVLAPRLTQRPVTASQRAAASGSCLPRRRSGASGRRRRRPTRRLLVGQRPQLFPAPGTSQEAHGSPLGRWSRPGRGRPVKKPGNTLPMYGSGDVTTWGRGHVSHGQSGQFLARRRVPEAHAAVVVGRGQHLSVGREGQVVHPADPANSVQFAAVGRVPKSEVISAAASGQHLAVGREGQLSRQRLAVGQHGQWSPAGRLPQAHLPGKL